MESAKAGISRQDISIKKWGAPLLPAPLVHIYTTIRRRTLESPRIPGLRWWEKKGWENERDTGVRETKSTYWGRKRKHDVTPTSETRDGRAKDATTPWQLSRENLTAQNPCSFFYPPSRDPKSSPKPSIRSCLPPSHHQQIFLTQRRSDDLSPQASRRASWRLQCCQIILCDHLIRSVNAIIRFTVYVTM